MAAQNSEIAAILARLANLLEIEGANPFRVRAYQNAARAVDELPRSVAVMLAEGTDLTELPGIGDDLAGKIKEIVDTGHLSLLAEIERRIPGELADIAALPGLGPKRTRLLHEKLHIDTLRDLRRAASAGQIERLRGFGSKTQQRIVAALARAEATPQRLKLLAAEQIAEPLLQYLKDAEGVKEIAIAGSYRRRKETVGDLDLLVAATDSTPAANRLLSFSGVEEVLARGPTRSTVRLHGGLQVDLRVVHPSSYGAALHYFTGSKSHNIAIRTLGLKKGLKINEYGVFRATRRIAGRTEKEIYAAVGLPYIEPELRENRGEIEAAHRNRLPHLVAIEDIRGDLHAHTKATDGKYSLEQMVDAARQRGYAYLAITDHSRHLTVARGFDGKRLAAQIRAIDRLNARLRGFRVLKSIELDILEDGKLDLSDSILDELDFTVAAVHFKLQLSRQRQTERILRAMDNRHVSILAHPTGRLLSGRSANQVDMERVMRAAVERGCFLELNAQPDRLDLDDVNCKMAKDLGVKVAVSTDAHRLSDFEFMRFGVWQARRGWLEAADVLNTRPWPELAKLLKR